MSRHYYEKETYKGFTIVLEPDELAESPREWGDESIFLVSFHTRQFDERPYDIKKTEDIEDWRETHHIYPLFGYSHSGVALSMGRGSYPFNCPWDGGQYGFVLVKKDAGWPEGPEGPEAAAASLVEEWNMFLSGDVWYFSVQDSSGEVLDSCGGIYGSDTALEDARRVVDACADDTKKVTMLVLRQQLDGNGTWKRVTFDVPVYVGDDDVEQWLKANAGDEQGSILRYVFEDAS